MPCIDMDDVESRAPRAQRGVAVPLAIGADIALGHGASLGGRIAPGIRHVARSDRDLAGVQIRRIHTGVDEFDGGECPVLMHGVRHERERWDIAIVPQPAFDEGRNVARSMDFHLLCADNSPTPFALTPRIAAWARGLIYPMPLQWGT